MFQIFRFGAFLLIGIVFAKSNLSVDAIGEYEEFLLLAGGVSFFWLNGLIRGLLPLAGDSNAEQHARFFNAFLVLSSITVLSIFLLLLIMPPLSDVLLADRSGLHLGLLLLYLFFSVPANLTEYYFLVAKESNKMLVYGIVGFSVMLLLVLVPVLWFGEMIFCLYGMVASAALRYGYLCFLLLSRGPIKFSVSFIRKYLTLSSPLILSALMSGSAQYIDGFIIASHFDQVKLAVFRFGARELPFVVLLTSTLSNAMLPFFGNPSELEANLQTVKNESARLSKFLFPLTFILLIFSHKLFPVVFNEQFEQSASVFNIYLLLITSRLLFPQTILVGLKRTSVIAWGAGLELAVNVMLSLWFVQIWGMEGVAYATVLAFLLEKIYLAFAVWRQVNIPVTKYLNISRHLSYSLLLLIVYYCIEFLIY